MNPSPGMIRPEFENQNELHRMHIMNDPSRKREEDVSSKSHSPYGPLRTEC